MKTTNTPTLNHWSEIEGGFRGSSFLKLGALFTVAGALTNLGANLLGGASSPSPTATIVAWLLYIVGLWLFTGGFVLAGTQRILTKFSILVGIFHGLQGIELLIILFTAIEVPVPAISMTVGRLISLLFFVYIERQDRKSVV